jgi:hypothetical protein
MAKILVFVRENSKCQDHDVVHDAALLQPCSWSSWGVRDLQQTCSRGGAVHAILSCEVMLCLSILLAMKVLQKQLLGVGGHTVIGRLSSCMGKM